MRFPIKTWVCIFLCGVSVLVPQYAAAWMQGECSIVSDAELNLDTLVSNKSACMSKGSNAVSLQLLHSDRLVVATTHTKVSEVYLSRGFEEKDVARITAVSWTNYRWEKQTAVMKVSDFLAMASSMGQLTVKSRPNAADITVDNKLWDSKTDATDWTSAGRREVRLNRSGCDETVAYVDVPPQGKVTFERDLNCD